MIQSQETTARRTYSYPTELGTRSSDVTFSMKLTIYGVALFCGGQMALSEMWVLKIAGIIVLGVMFAHGVELQHQALHNQGFRNRKLNEIAGVMLGIPMLVSYASYQASHLRHHRLLGTPENKEFFNYGDQYGASLLRSISAWCLRFLMLNIYISFFKNLAVTLLNRAFKDVSPTMSKRFRRDYLAIFLVVAACGAASVLQQTAIFLWLWLFPLVVVATPVHALIEMPEHYQCDTLNTDVFQNTRTIKSNAFMYWLTNGNNYHVEHHLMPGLSIDRLHDLHLVIQQDIKYLELTYFKFYCRLIFRRKSADQSRTE